MNYGKFEESVEVGDVVYFKVNGKEVAGDVIEELLNALKEESK